MSLRVCVSLRECLRVLVRLPSSCVWEEMWSIVVEEMECGGDDDVVVVVVVGRKCAQRRWW
ncbi:hypothetical protein E2C01_084262 [Portunus trituberculatus]|uniref:Uncharacterized protein n=1 Tax=Portunus trituberculatus TaxID=210409 RepID=A0A5B7IZH1_PORTR|nr:hypothetical protein [Portunus trituberculatus]